MNAGLDLLLRNEAATLALEAVRVSGMVMVAPLGWTNAPTRIKVALVILLTFIAHGDIGQVPVSEEPVEALAFSVGFELVLGVAIGLVPRLLVSAVEIAGEQIGPMMGIGVAQVFDPSTHGTQNVITVMLRHLAVFVGILLGLHRLVIAAVIGSFRVVPAGTLHGLDGLTPIVMQLSHQAIASGVRLAIPLLAVLLMTQIALAFVSRAAPAMQVFSIGFAVTMLVGGLLLMRTLPDFCYELAAEMSRVGERIEAILLAVKER